MSDSLKVEMADQRAPIQGWQVQDEKPPRLKSLISF